MLRETAVERYTFRCHHCGHAWTRGYEVVHVTDSDGHTREYYTLNGLPVAAPGGTRSVACPRCGAEHPATTYVGSPQDSQRPTGGERERVPGHRPPESARQIVHEIGSLLTAAKDPGHRGFAQVGEVKAVAQAMQEAVGDLPELLHELANTLEHAQRRPHSRHAGDIPTGIHALHRAADRADVLTAPVTDELGHVRAALTTLESFSIHP